VNIIDVEIEKIFPYENNARCNDDAVKSVCASLQEFGWQQPIVCDSNMVIIAGHTRLKAALKLGYKTCPVLIAEGLSEDKVRMYRLQDNNIRSSWDIEKLEMEISSFNLDKAFDFEKLDFKPFDGVEQEEEKIEEVEGENDIPEVKESICKMGDLWQLGNHRLLCGDSTDAYQVARLMSGEKIDMIFSDPPYGVSYADKNEFLNNHDKGNMNQTEIKNDHLSFEDTGKLWANVFTAWHEYLADYSCYYIASPQMTELNFLLMKSMNENNFHLKHTLIWNKNNHVLGRCDYMYKHEPILYGWKNRHKFYKKGSQNKSVIDINKPLKNDLHPTMKPIELVENFILNSTLEGMLVSDMFLGSGTTLIACEKTNRRCFGMELDEEYCDVIIKRWEDFTNRKAVKI